MRWAAAYPGRALKRETDADIRGGRLGRQARLWLALFDKHNLLDGHLNQPLHWYLHDALHRHLLRYQPLLLNRNLHLLLDGERHLLHLGHLLLYHPLHHRWLPRPGALCRKLPIEPHNLRRPHPISVIYCNRREFVKRKALCYFGVLLKFLRRKNCDTFLQKADKVITSAFSRSTRA